MHELSVEEMKNAELNFVPREDRTEEAWPETMSTEQRAEVMRLRWRHITPTERLRKGC